MLKDYKVGKAYEYFSSGWLQEGYFLKAKSNNNNNLCILRTKCSPSQTLDDATTLCHVFVRNISAKIAHHWLQSLLLLSNGPELALHRHDREFKKTCINFIPCSTRTISSFCQTIIFFGAISIHCGGHHTVSVMVNILFLKYTSCCCST
jgi:hypothetical protein